MKLEDLKLEQDRIISKLQGLQLLNAAIHVESKKLIKHLEELKQSENPDYEEIVEVCDKVEKLRKKANYVQGLIDEAYEEARRLIVTLYGPFGGTLFDSLIQGMEGTPD